jgi:hypothetical protein
MNKELDLILNPNIIFKKNGNIVIQNVRNIVFRKDNENIVINFIDETFGIIDKEDFYELTNKGEL